MAVDDAPVTRAGRARGCRLTPVSTQRCGPAGGPGPCQGLQLTGEGGLLQRLTKLVLESALDGEITDHLGYDKHDPAGQNTGNSRNGSRAKTVLTDVGPVEIDVPRDRAGTFDADHRA